MESFSEDTLFNITSYLTSHDILNLALTCRHFGGKPGGVDVSLNKKRKANTESSRERQWSLMEEMAKRRVEATKRDTDWQEKYHNTDWQDPNRTDVYKLTSRTGNESWIRIDNCIQKMISELVFHRLFGSGGAGVGYMGKNPSCIGMKFGEVLPNEIHTGEVDMTNSIAVCQDIMTEGRHYAEFTILQEGWIAPGIMHPIKNCHDALLVKHIPLQEGEGWPDILQTYEKCCEWQKWNVTSEMNRLHQFIDDDAPRGIRLQSKGTVIGLLLDFDADMLMIYVNGVIQVEYSGGISGGQYSWATLISRTNDDRGSVKVKRGIPPPPVRRGTDGMWPRRWLI